MVVVLPAPFIPTMRITNGLSDVGICNGWLTGSRMIRRGTETDKVEQDPMEIAHPQPVVAEGEMVTVMVLSSWRKKIATTHGKHIQVLCRQYPNLH